MGSTPGIVRGILLMMAFCVLAPVMDVLAKMATAYVPAAQVALARFSVQGGVLLPILLASGGVRGLTLPLLGWHVLRGVAIAAATITFMEALRHMPLADALAIVFVEPLILTLFSAWFLGETIGWRRILACLIGLFGSMLVVQPSFADFGWVAALPLATAVFFAVYVLLTRFLSASSSPLAQQAFSGFFGGLVVAGVLWFGEGSGSEVFDPIWPPRAVLWLLIGVGLMATLSHFFLTLALSAAPASALAPIGYLEIVAATALGFLVFGDFPDPLRWLGIVIIVGSGLFVLWRERQQERGLVAAHTLAAREGRQIGTNDP